MHTSENRNIIINTPLLLSCMLLLASIAGAEIKTQAIDYTHGDTQLQGYLAYNTRADARRPGVIVVHEWYGVNDYAKMRARQLAEMGYVAFVADMYGKGVQAKSVEEAGKLSASIKGDRKLMRERINHAVEVLRKQEQVDPARIAAIGYCFGGTVALELARSGAEVAGVVSFHGDLTTPNPKETQNVKAKILVAHGADDPFVPPAQVVGFMEEMKNAKADYEIVMYSGAVHSFTNPNAGSAGLQGVAYQEKADRRSWESMQDFFGQIFKQSQH